MGLIILQPSGLIILLFCVILGIQIGKGHVTYVEWVDSDAARIGTTARLVCLFEVQFPFTFQYAEFTKILPGGGRTSAGERVFVYELNRCSNIDRGYNELAGRGSVVLVEPDPTVMNTPVPGTGGFGVTQAPTGLPGAITATPRPLGRGSRGDNTIAVYDPDREMMVFPSDNAVPLAAPTVAGEGVITLLIENVTFADQATYECAIKGVDGPRMTNLWDLEVVVLPSQPVLIQIEEPAVEDNNVTLLCQANLGKPRGEITWFRRDPTETEFSTIPEEEVMTDLVDNDNGTTSAVSTFTFLAAEEDNGAVYKCELSSSNLRPWESNPSSEITLSVEYPPKDGRILFDAQVGRYLCVAEGNPTPEFMWLWVVGEDDRRIVSTDRYLDLSVIEESGLFTFRCVASNVINTVRNTRIMDTEIRVLGNPGGTRPPYVNGGYRYRSTESPVRGADTPGSFQSLLYGGNLGMPLDVKITDNEFIPIFRPEDILGGFDDGHSHQGYAVTDLPLEERLRTIPTTPAPATTTTTTTTTVAPTTPAPLQTRSVRDRNAARNANPRNNRNAGGFGGFGGGGGDYDDYEEIMIIKPMHYGRRNHYGKELTEDGPAEPISAETGSDELPVWDDMNLDDLISNLSAEETTPEEPVTPKPNPFLDILRKKTKKLQEAAEQEKMAVSERRNRFKISPESGEDNYLYDNEDNYTDESNFVPSQQNHKVAKFDNPKRPDINMKEISDLQKTDAEEDYDIDPKKYYDPQVEQDAGGQGLRMETNPRVPERQERLYRPRRPGQPRARTTEGRTAPRRRAPARRRRPPVSRGKTGRTRSPSEPLGNNLLRNPSRRAPRTQPGRTRSSPFASLSQRTKGKSSTAPDSFRPRYLPQQSNRMTLAKLQAMKSQQQQALNRPHFRPAARYDFIDKPYASGESFRSRYAKMAPEENEAEEYPVEEPDPFLELEQEHVVETIDGRYNPHTNRVVAAVSPPEVKAPPPLFQPPAPPVMSNNLPEDNTIGRSTDRVKYEHEDAVPASHDEHDCRDRADGPYGGGCLAFYRCQGGKTFYVECHEGYVFNRRAGQCDEAKNAPMPCGKWIDCAGKPSGKYANFDSDCRSYYTCMSGVYFGSTDCPKGTAFDEKKGVCDWLENVPPPCGTGGLQDRPLGRFDS